MRNLNHKSNNSLDYDQRDIKESRNIRKIIAQDFHDEMGHRLTRISMLAELIRSKAKSNDVEFIRLVELINDNASMLDSGTREFIWAIDPNNNSLWEMAVRLKDFGDDLFEFQDISFGIKGLDPAFKRLNMPMELLRHITLIFKEGMTNILKHAQAKHVELIFEAGKSNIEIMLKDDGKGFDFKSAVGGNGLENILGRAKKMDLDLNINSHRNQGTQITCKANIRNQITP